MFSRRLLTLNLVTYIKHNRVILIFILFLLGICSSGGNDEDTQLVRQIPVLKMTTLKHTCPVVVSKKNGGPVTMFSSRETSSSTTKQDKQINVSSPIINQASSQTKSPVQLRTFSKRFPFIDKSYEKNGKIVSPQSQPRFLHESCINRNQIPTNPFAHNISERMFNFILDFNYSLDTSHSSNN